jgi:hypothetical protein
MGLCRLRCKDLLTWRDALNPPASCRRDVTETLTEPSSRLRTRQHVRSCDCWHVQHEAASNVTSHHTSITGSTPVAASNLSPAHEHFLAFAARPLPSNSAGLPTFCRRDCTVRRRTRENGQLRWPQPRSSEALSAPPAGRPTQSTRLCLLFGQRRRMQLRRPSSIG